MRLSIILLAFILAFVLLANCEAGRRSGGGSRSRGSSSSRRRNNYGSSSSSNSGGFLRNIFKPKPKPKPKNPQSSYPRQTYGTNQNVGGGTNYNNNNNRGIGGGGFVNPSGGNANNRGIGGGGFVNPNKGGTSGGFGSNSNRGYGSNNYYGGSNYGSWSSSNRNKFLGAGTAGYYSGGSFKPKKGIFASGGKRAFGLGAGAGFLGGAMAAAGAMSIYHHYRQYQAMMYYRNSMFGGGYGGYGGFGGYGYNYSPYGRSILVNANDCVGGCPNQAFCDYGICRCREGFEARFGSCFRNFQSTYNSRHEEFDRRTQSSFDPYIPCSSHSACKNIDMNMVCQNMQKCQCRNDMKWNTDVGECQIFMDVDCTQSEPKVLPLDTNGTITTTTVAPSVVETTTLDPINATLEELPDNITEVEVKDTLKHSELTKLDVNKTSDAEIKAAFCREIGSIASRFQQEESRYRYDSVNSEHIKKTVFGIGTIALIIVLVCCCCCCVCVCLCLKKIKNTFQDLMGGGGGHRDDEDSSSKNDYQMEQNNDMNREVMPVMPPNDPGQAAPPYPMAPGQQQPMYPPQQPPAPGYPDMNNTATPYPPVYPPAGAPDNNPAPYPPPTAPPGGGYGQQPGFNPAYPPYPTA